MIKLLGYYNKLLSYKAIRISDKAITLSVKTGVMMCTYLCLHIIDIISFMYTYYFLCLLEICYRYIIDILINTYTMDVF